MILEEILFKKKARIEEIKRKRPLNLLISEIKDKKDRNCYLHHQFVIRDFTSGIKRENGIKFIGEIKFASPSKGVIRNYHDLSSIAEIYEKNVDALSVLTEEDFFKGSLLYLEAVKKRVTKPILRKDFIIDEYQVYESLLYGADAILLIASILDKGQSRDYFSLAKELGLSVLFEVHDASELEKALSAGADIIGINNRDLKTMRIDLMTTLSLKPLIPSDKIVVSESGIRTRDDVRRLEDAGIDALLIGTVFMESEDIEKKINELKGIKEENK
jgi:indole-3-glycerol phosphate synthase